MAPVQLYVYDLSNGMARALSQSIVGRQIDAIWHTSVVVYGVEYFFGSSDGGIGTSNPGRSPYGHPVEIVQMGDTQIDRPTVLEFVRDLRGIYTGDKYHLLDNNCNNFSNEFCQMLVGKQIPAHITSLPGDFLQTPLGQMLRPMIDGMMGSRANVAPVLTPNSSRPMFPPHAHSALSFECNIHRFEPINFAQINYNPIFTKLLTFDLFESDRMFITDLKARLEKNRGLSSGWLKKVETVLKHLGSEKMFPMLDILRIVSLKEDSRLLDDKGSLILYILHSYGMAKQAEKAGAPIATVLMILRMLANLLAMPKTRSSLLSSDIMPSDSSTADIIAIPPVQLVVNVVLSHLLESGQDYSPKYSADMKFQEALSSVIYNISLFISAIRHKRHGIATSNDYPVVSVAWDNELDEPEFVVETFSAVIHVLGEMTKRSDIIVDVAHRYLAATVYFLFLAPGETMLELASVLDLSPIVEKISKKDSKLTSLCRDIQKILK